MDLPEPDAAHAASTDIVLLVVFILFRGAWGTIIVRSGPNFLVILPTTTSASTFVFLVRRRYPSSHRDS